SMVVFRADAASAGASTPNAIPLKAPDAPSAAAAKIWLHFMALLRNCVGLKSEIQPNQGVQGIVVRRVAARSVVVGPGAVELRIPDILRVQLPIEPLLRVDLRERAARIWCQ